MFYELMQPAIRLILYEIIAPKHEIIALRCEYDAMSCLWLCV